MTDDNNQLEKTNTTFRFSSGQLLTLDEQQVATIPYLAAMVSSADRFDSARDEHGHYKLDPNINHQHFSLILQSLPFHSIRQVFTCIPEEENVIRIVALLDFLGLLPYSPPSLEEVDSIFFSSVVYSPYCKEHLRIVKPDVLQDMAVRFAIAMIKEEYDFDQCQVMDHIYWFVMFIVSVREWFGPRLRHHVYTTAKNCFTVFNPSLLNSLKKLKHTSKKEGSKESSVRSNAQFGLSDKCIYSYLATHVTFVSGTTGWERYSSISWSPFIRPKLRRSKLVCSVYENKEWFPCGEELHNEDPSELIYRRVLEIMYARLQNKLCQQARAELQQQKYSYKFTSSDSYLWTEFDLYNDETLRKKIMNILGRQCVSEEIDALILQDICFLTSKLEHEHAKLVQSIQNYEEISGELNENLGSPFIFRSFSRLLHRIEKQRASLYEVLLDKLHKNSCGRVKDIRERVLVGLKEVALKQFHQWMCTQQEIAQIELDFTETKEGGSLQRLLQDLKLELRPNRQGDHPYTRKKNDKRHQHDQFLPKVSANRHLKHSKR